MTVHTGASFDKISRQAGSLIERELRLNKSLLLCTATGHSPLLTYQYLAESYKHDPQLFSDIRIIKLDEWGGLPMTHEGTCEYFLQKNIIRPLAVTCDRFVSFRSDAENPDNECERIRQWLAGQGPVDISILGIGMNGHVALNEPAPTLQPYCHTAKLASSTRQHPMIADSVLKPEYGLTLGMAEIFQSKKIILIISGQQKKEITKKFLCGKITTGLPASFLWLHPDVTCLIDDNALNNN
jgi:galactosamine-6-phosphate isomerase